MESDLLKQLENSLISYQENQETLDIVVRTAQSIFGRNWMDQLSQAFDDAEIELFRKVYTEGKEEGEFDIDNIELVADITHYCVKGLEVPYIRGHIAHGMKEEDTKPQVAKVVYGALGKFQRK